MNQRQNLKNCYITISILVILFLVFLIETAIGGSENIYVLMKLGA